MNRKNQPGFNSSFSFSSFIAEGYNRKVLNTLLKISSSQSLPPYILIEGDAGLGKTHLFNALGNAFTQRYLQAKVYHCTAEDFLAEQGQGKNKNPSEFIKSLDFLFIEDIQFRLNESRQADFLASIMSTVWSHGGVVVATLNPFRYSPAYEYCPEIEQAFQSIETLPPQQLTLRLGKYSHFEKKEILKKRAGFDLHLLPWQVLDLLSDASDNINDVLALYARLIIYCDFSGKPISPEAASEITSDFLKSKPGLSDIAGMKFVQIPGGCFDMGDIHEIGNEDELPPINKRIKSFLMSDAPVTQEQFEQVMGYNPAAHKGPECPVENVSWKEAFRFAVTLGGKTGQHIRLPFEWEWEYAARSGGLHAEIFSGNDNEASLDDFAWHFGNSANKTHAVKSKHCNGLGLYDMSGNVYEWTASHYNPKGHRPIEGTLKRDFERVVKGGSFGNYPAFLRASARCGLAPTFKADNLGFRSVCQPIS